MKAQFYTILIILSTFIVLFSTTFLLDLEIIATSWPRKIIIYFLMAAEAFIGFSLLKSIITSS